MNFTNRLDYLSQFSNAVLSPGAEVKVTHYQTGARKYSPFMWPLTEKERKVREKWCKQQLELLKTNESTAVMSFLIKEHSE